MSFTHHTGRASSMSSPLRDKLRISPTLPTPNNMIQEKHSLRNGRSQWTATYYIQFPPSLPFVGRHKSPLVLGMQPRRRGGLAGLFAPRRLKIIVPLPRNIYRSAVAYYGRQLANAGTFVLCLFALWIFISLTKRSQYHHTESRGSDNGDSEPPTLVFARQDLQRVWEWEIASGHYPSSRKIPEQIKITIPPFNPAVPRKQNSPQSQRSSQQQLQRPGLTGAAASTNSTPTIGSGPQRTYLDIRSAGLGVAYPPRPVPGSAADLDIIMDHCDFSLNKYVRDCLEVLRIGAGLDNSKRMRRGKTDDWQYIYMEEDRRLDQYPPIAAPQPKAPYSTRALENPDAGLVFRTGEVKEPHLRLPPPRTYRPYVESTHPCDPDYPRIFHMFWTGPFTDKPYLAILSFLFTQNVGLHIPPDETTSKTDICRPQFWLWINPGPAAAVPNPTAVRDMFDTLSRNPWSSPFLHPRFREVIKFKLWNTTEQLDGVPEIKDEWRSFSIFNSGGHVIEVPKPKDEQIKGKKRDGEATYSNEDAIFNSYDDKGAATTETVDGSAQGAGTTAGMDPSATNQPLNSHEDDIFQRTGTTSSSTYDRLSVILSDLARFILCHRFGGTYLDADTIFLRDWEELWGWKGAFAYRWSRLEKYNTAVLRMNKNSAFGTFLFRTALRNGMDFHPMTISKYVKDAHLDGLLLRLPDALFDPAWLGTENYQRDRPPYPYFAEFFDFFETPATSSAAPQVLGFEGFFRGAFSYHFHNFWWRPFDPQRNWPDLGERFIQGEKTARKKLYETKVKDPHGASQLNAKPGPSPPISNSNSYSSSWLLDDVPEEAYMTEDHIEDDKRDLDWATVLKRTFESYIRGERPNMYGEWIVWT